MTDTSLLLQEQQPSVSGREAQSSAAMHQDSRSQHAAVRAVAQAATALAGAAHHHVVAQQSDRAAAEAKQPPPAAASAAAAAGTDSEDDSWTPGTDQKQQGQAQTSSGDDEHADAAEDAEDGDDAAASAGDSSDDDMMAAAAYDDLGDDADMDEAAWDPDMPPPVYCTNCTARIYVADRCSDCGHSNDEDDALLSCSAASADTAAAAAAPAGECPLIIWDDSMLLHEEGKLEPHPERPDRLRAVMAQLTGNGLTSGFGSSSRTARDACQHQQLSCDASLIIESRVQVAGCARCQHNPVTHQNTRVIQTCRFLHPAAAGLCQRLPARLATKQELLRVHTPDHLHRLQLFCSGQVPPSVIPSDTYINQHTLQCAALAAGSAAEVAVRVWQGEGPCGAAIIRPPGHHAESNTGEHLSHAVAVPGSAGSCGVHAQRPALSRAGRLCLHDSTKLAVPLDALCWMSTVAYQRWTNSALPRIPAAALSLTAICLPPCLHCCCSHGLLLLQQRSSGGAGSAGGRRGARADPGLGCAPRQRHAAHFRKRQQRDVHEPAPLRQVSAAVGGAQAVGCGGLPVHSAGGQRHGHTQNLWQVNVTTLAAMQRCADRRPVLPCVCRGTFYPGTGAATEVGRGKGEGFTVNVPWETDGVCDSDYMAAMEQVRSFNLLRWQGLFLQRFTVCLNSTVRTAGKLSSSMHVWMRVVRCLQPIRHSLTSVFPLWRACVPVCRCCCPSLMSLRRTSSSSPPASTRRRATPSVAATSRPSALAP